MAWDGSAEARESPASRWRWSSSSLGRVTCAGDAVTPIGSDLPIVGRMSRLPLGKLGPVGDVPAVIRELIETGLIHPVRPDKLARIIREVARWGTTPAASIAASNIESPHDVGFVDELG